MNRLLFGDNLPWLRKREVFPDESVDLIYLDPPFNSQEEYNVLFREKGTRGKESEAQIHAFTDTWHWADAEPTYREFLKTCRIAEAVTAVEAFKQLLGDSPMMAYLAMMAPRLVELRRVLKPTGSIYLHCDPTASHYLKMLLDAVFGRQMFCNEIVWQRTGAHGGSRRFGPIHDIILFYAKSEAYLWNPAYVPLSQDTADAWFNNVEPGTGRRFNRNTLTAPGVRSGSSGKPWRGIDPSAKGRHWAVPGFARDVIGDLDTIEALDSLERMGRVFWPKKGGGTPMLKLYLDESKGVPALDVWTDIRLQTSASERLGYPTQKPEALLERIISASSNEGDTVLDPFCGCGTTVAAAQKLNRQWVGIDITYLAINLIKRRLDSAFGKGNVTYAEQGQPVDLTGARALAELDRFQFQQWALDLVAALPVKTGAGKGKDRGVDGLLFFYESKDERRKILVQVKSGGVARKDVATLVGDVGNQQAAGGILITLEPPTEDMRKEAVDAGRYTSSLWIKTDYPKIQILTIRQLLDGAEPNTPPLQDPFAKAPPAAVMGQMELPH